MIQEQYALIGCIDDTDRPNTEMLFIGCYSDCTRAEYLLNKFLDNKTNAKDLGVLENMSIVLPESEHKLNIFGVIKYSLISGDNAYAESKLKELQTVFFDDKPLIKFINKIYQDGFEDGVNSDEHADKKV